MMSNISIENVNNEFLDLKNSSEVICIKRVKPVRSFTGEKYRTNTRNKKLLREDFSHRCCYCDDYDEIRSSYEDYQVEHFAPKEKFPDLKFVYENLLYSCRTCNRGKWDFWPSDDPSISVVDNIGFLDPCENEYYNHLARKKSGEIIYLTELGEFMYKKLNLFLDIHLISYKLERYRELLNKLKQKMSDENLSAEELEKLKALKLLVDDEFQNYYSIKLDE